jgi:DNA replication initiation complex subunit (GINS family)
MIDYNELYEILRKEKYSEVLQPLAKNFVSDVSAYLIEKKEESSREGDLFSDNVTKSKKQLENAIAVFKELMLRRKKKILNLVFVAAETGVMKRDFDNMLGFEKEVFEKLVETVESGDKKIAQILKGDEKKEVEINRMIMLNQDVEEFVDMEGESVGPFVAGELANLDTKVAGILVEGEKSSFVDEE